MILKRLIQTVPTLIGITVVAFSLVRLTGDPARVMLPPETPEEVREEFRQRFGLDQPLPVQYLTFVVRAVQGDFGDSIRYRTSALELVVERLPATAELGLTAILISLVVGLPLGVVAAVRHNTWVDRLARLIALTGQALPSFYLGLMAIVVFGAWLKLLPTGGRGELNQLVLPSVTLATFLIPIVVRFVRGAVLDVLRQDFVRTGRSKGLSESRLLWVHVLRNAMIPVVTIVGLQVGTVLSGAVVTETVFSWPGVGRLMVESIFTRDFPIVQTVVVVLALIFIVVNLLVDLTYSWLDPRIQR